MSKAVYTGEGNYNPDTFVATYNVYLPTLGPGEGTYKFHTNKVYNFSSSNYPNTVLIFMEVLNGSNGGFKGSTNDPATAVTFSVNQQNLTNIASTCTPITPTGNITVIIMHDDDQDDVFASLNYYDTAPPTESSVSDKNNGKLESPFMPKKSGRGILVPKKLGII